MSRNNEKRLGMPNPPVSSSPIPAMAMGDMAQQAPLQFTVPTDFVELPSEGEFYPEGNSLKGTKEIEMYHMTTKQEDILSSKALIKRGIAIERMLQSLIIDKSIDLDSLLLGDKNALMLHARIMGYGSFYEAPIVCPICSEKTNKTYNLEEDIKIRTATQIREEVIEKNLAVLTADNTFIVHLPKMNVDVECRLLTGVEERKLTQLAEGKRKHNLEETSLTDQFRAIIVSVNGNNLPETISSLIRAMPAIDSAYLRDVYKMCVPDIDMAQEFTCPYCDCESALQIPFTTEFFWPKRQLHGGSV